MHFSTQILSQHLQIFLKCFQGSSCIRKEGKKIAEKWKAHKKFLFIHPSTIFPLLLLLPLDLVEIFVFLCMGRHDYIFSIIFVWILAWLFKMRSEEFHGWCHCQWHVGAEYIKRGERDEGRWRGKAMPFLNFAPHQKSIMEDYENETRSDPYLFFFVKKIPWNNGKIFFSCFVLIKRGCDVIRQKRLIAFSSANSKARNSILTNCVLYKFVLLLQMKRKVHSVLRSEREFRFSILAMLASFSSRDGWSEKRKKNLKIFSLSLLWNRIHFFFFPSHGSELLAFTTNIINNKTFFFTFSSSFSCCSRFMHNTEIYSSQLSRNNIKNV